MMPPEQLMPLIEALPEPLASFLRSGGWLAVLGLIGLLALLMALSILRRLLVRRKRPSSGDAQITEDLSTYPPPPALWGEKRLTLHGMPVRMRLLVAAPLGTEGGLLSPDEFEQILEQVMPGLGYFTRIDKPRMRIWPMQLSHQGFVAAFRRHTHRPDPDNHVSRWILVMGKAIYLKRPLVLGLVLLADQDSTFGRIIIEHPHQWMEALRVRDHREP